ncbi:MAG: hypothetical protein COW24_00160 [Candidatus Kerfeldbacteria bacterium CG15_BIG_FIL_POST_REV_8_21_14_020_45_12]|uniref:Dickkopf N-terminal cysteine-rich domain-containing protein n=1 Tax=Candidatus Kerfeldbacteria bacterium CG15_BIG_FIL_POST_REV_8_21_14_020_45_12 TaxID=2014247 RepID=A0A2M7H5D7_9BACT|nr:MAG: hypothetical protein COW24_00160 [Candidatus Kerfeldbacteria bacterium CG15_BIG_FIL_POST_REV_8_21_14_020_45_12]PJA92896.1 MAG: hypothetical protein CO132_05890 [Candidatus Kerfeldbacteria bacterium CG_4_9_14_3_um_filter_45_8]
MNKHILKKISGRKFLLAAIIGFLFIGIPSFALAASCDFPAVTIEVPLGTVGKVYGLTDYISQLYKFLVGSVGILSAVMIMINGLRWAAAAGNADQISEAKSGVLGAFVGLILALTSYIILVNINAGLAALPEICPEGLAFTAALTTSGWEACPGTSVTECNGVDYCAYAGGCECVNIGSTTTDFVCRPVGADVLPANIRCKQDSNCVGYATNTLQCVGANTAGTVPGNCILPEASHVCTTDSDCTPPYTCVDTSTSGSKQCMTATGRVDYTSCENDGQCESTACNETKGICSPGNGTENATVAPCGGDDDCVEGYTCGTGSLCRAKAEGDSCDSLNSECGSLFCVDTLGGNECYDGSSGDPCDVDQDCQSTNCIDTYGDNECYDGNTGDPCNVGTDCISGTCIDNLIENDECS